MEKPIVSVLLPVYNEKTDFLRRAVESVLAQTLADFELLLLDDGSNAPGTVAEIERLKGTDRRIRVFAHENMGLTKTLNHGLSVARGRYICRQDSDDWSEPERFRKQVELLELEPALSVVGTNYTLYREDGRMLWGVDLPLNPLEVKKAFEYTNPFCHGATCFRKSHALAVGGYNESFRTAQDYDFFWRLCDHGGGANLADALYNHTRTATSVMTRRKAENFITPYVIRELAAMRKDGVAEDMASARQRAFNAARGIDLEHRAALKSADNCMLAGAYGKALCIYFKAIGSRPFLSGGYLKLARFLIYFLLPPFRKRLFTN